MGKVGVKAPAAALVLAVLGGCSTAPAQQPSGPAPPGPTASVVRPKAPPGRIEIAAAPLPIPVLLPPDTCGAYLLQSLVGQPRTQIPVPLQPSRRRVVCTTCPTTQDYRPDRQTIQYDAASNLVTSVACN